MPRNAVLAALVLAAASMVLLALLVWLVGQGILLPGEDAQARDVQSGGTRLTGDATGPGDDRPSGDAATSRRSLETRTPDARALAPEVVIAGRCLDESALPLAGVEIELTTAEGTPTYALDLHRFRHPDMVWDEPPIEVRSGRNGRFELRLRTPPVYRGWHLHLRAEGRVPLEQTFDELTPGCHDLGDVRLRRGCLVSGAVRDAKGRPHAGVRVFFSRDVDWTRPVVEGHFLEARTLPDGTFRAPEPLAPDGWEVSVHGAQLPGEKPLLVDLTGRTSHHLQILVRNFEEVDEITGWVVDQAGDPLVPSLVHFEPTGDYASTLWSQTGPGGRFLVQRRQRDPAGKVTLIVSRNGRPVHRIPDVSWNTRDLRIVVPPPPEGQELIVREAGTGRPVEHYAVVHQKARTRDGFDILKPLGHLQRHPGGRVVVRLSEGRHRLTVVPRDPDLAWSEPQDLEVGREPRAPVVVVLREKGARPVKVVDVAGQPVAGVRLQLLRPAFDGRRQRLSVIDPLQTGGAGGPSLAVLEQEWVTDSDGRQVLRGNPTHPCLLRVMSPMHLPRLLWEVIPDARFGELRIVLDPGCTVRGRVEPPELWERFSGIRPVPGESEESPGIGFRVRSLAPGIPRRLSSPALPDPRGRFVIPGLPPGPAELVMAWVFRDGEELDPQVTTVHRWSELPAGRPAEVVVDLRRFQLVPIRGLATCNGQPLADAWITVSVVREVGGAHKTVMGFRMKSDAGGRFACRTLAGEWHARWFPEAEGSISPSLVVRAGPVAPDTRTMDLAFTSGALDLVLQREDGTPVGGVVVFATPEDRPGRAHGLPRSDPGGRSGLPHMPPGEYHLWTWPRSLASSEARRQAFGGEPGAAHKARVALGTIKVVMGQALRRRLILPAAAGY